MIDLRPPDHRLLMPLDQVFQIVEAGADVAGEVVDSRGAGGVGAFREAERVRDAGWRRGSAVIDFSLRSAKTTLCGRA